MPIWKVSAHRKRHVYMRMHEHKSIPSPCIIGVRAARSHTVMWGTSMNVAEPQPVCHDTGCDGTEHPRPAPYIYLGIGRSAMEMKVQWRRKRRRPKRRWLDKVKDDIKEKGLPADEVYDRTWTRIGII